jgi:hypothetical protein
MLLTLPLVARFAYADAASALRCQQTINKQLSTFIRKKAKILRTCKEGAVKRADPASPTDCPLTKHDDKITAAAQKLKDKIAASCGGKNKACNATDVGEDADELLADIGWDIGTCPDLAGEGCINAINDCNDIGTCAACIGQAAVDRASEIAYDLLVASEFGTGSDVNRCQVAIGKAGTKFLRDKSKILRACWGKVLAGKAGFTSPPGCPDTDAKTADKIARAEQKKVHAICQACGAGGDADKDAACDVPAGAFSPTAIGFEPDCPDVTVPGSPTSCAVTVSTLANLIDCVDCVTEFAVDCAAALGVPAQTAYPAECNATP